MDNQEIIIRVANSGDSHYAETITNEMEQSAKARGTGIAKRSPEYVANKMNEGKAVIALTKMAHGWASVILKHGAMVHLLQTAD